MFVVLILVFCLRALPTSLPGKLVLYFLSAWSSTDCDCPFLLTWPLFSSWYCRGLLGLCCILHLTLSKDVHPAAEAVAQLPPHQLWPVHSHPRSPVT